MREAHCIACDVVEEVGDGLIVGEYLRHRRHLRATEILRVRAANAVAEVLHLSLP